MRSYQSLFSPLKGAFKDTFLTTTDLAWRKEVAQPAGPFLRDLRNRIEEPFAAHRQQMRSVTDQPMSALAVQATAYSAGQKDKPPEMVVNLDEKESAKESEQHEEILGQLDGQLSSKNATTQIQIQMLKKCLLAIALWYVILMSGTGNLLVGPFATQAGCEDYRSQIQKANESSDGNLNVGVPFSCFSTKQ